MQRHRRFYIVTGILVSLGLLAALLPYGLNFALGRLLLNNGWSDVSIEAVTFSPFDAVLTLDHTRAVNAADKGFEFEKLQIDLDASALFKGELVIERIQLNRPSLSIRLNSDDENHIGGYALKQDASGDASSEATEPFAVVIRALSVESGSVDLQIGELHERITLQHFTLNGLNSHQLQEPINFSLASSLLNGELSGGGTWALKSNGGSRIEVNAELSNLDSRTLLPMLPSNIRQFGAILNGPLSLTTDISSTNSRWQIDSDVSLSDIAYQDDLHEFSASGVSVTGQGQFSFPSTSLEWNGNWAIDEPQFDAVISGTSTHISAKRISRSGDFIFRNQPQRLLIIHTGLFQAREFQLNRPDLKLTQATLDWDGINVIRRQQSDDRQQLVFDIGAAGSLNGDDTQLKSQTLTIENQLALWDGQATLHIPLQVGEQSSDSDDIAVLDFDGDAEVNGFYLDNPQVTLRAGAFKHVGPNRWRLNDDSRPLIFGSLEASARDFGLTIHKLNKSLKFEALHSEDVLLSYPSRVVFRKNRVEGLTITREEETLFSADSANAYLVELLEGKIVAISDIQSRHTRLNIGRDNDGNWNWANPDSGDKESSANADPYRLIIKQIEMVGDTETHFNDQFVSPPFQAVLASEKFVINDIDSGKPRQPIQLTYQGAYNRHSPLSISGTLKPFMKKVEFDLKASIKDVEIPPFSSYTRSILGYRFTSGQMGIEIDAKADSNALNGTSVIRLHRANVEPISTEEQEELDKTIGMPLETALAMLRNDDGDIKLTVPISGDLDKPNFSLSDAINQAVGKAVKGSSMAYLKYSLQPFGTIIFALEKIADVISYVRFEPMQFAPGQSELNASAIEYGKKLITILSEREDLRINLCGFATRSDREYLEKEHTEKSETDDDENRKQIDEASLNEKLHQLARRRAEALKSYLIEQGELKASRLFVCLPQVKTDSDKTPRVEISM